MGKTFFRFVMLPVMILAFSSNAGAISLKVGETDLSLGGSVRIDSGWRFSDYGDTDSRVDDEADFFTEHPSNSRASLKAVTGRLTGFVELGLGTGGGRSSSVNTRHAYLTYNMGDGNKVLIGHTWVPVSEDGPSQRLYYDNGLCYFGELSFVRGPQLRFEHSRDNLTFQVAVLEARTDFEDTANYVTEDAVPAIAASLIYDNGKINVTPGFFAQRYELRATADAGQYSSDTAITTCILSLNASAKIDPAVLSGEFWYGRNAGVAADISAGGRNTEFGWPVFDGDAAGQDIEDVESYGGWLQLAAPLKTGTCRAGAGFQRTEVSQDTAGYENNVGTWAIFVNYEYPVLKGFTITPEILYADYGNAPDKNLYGTGRNDLGTDIFVGVHFQYDF